MCIVCNDNTLFSNSDAVNKGVPRPKAETKEEKKARKQQIKQERRVLLLHSTAAH